VMVGVRLERKGRSNFTNFGNRSLNLIPHLTALTELRGFNAVSKRVCLISHRSISRAPSLIFSLNLVFTVR
jgi:hypothetical protein